MVDWKALLNDAVSGMDQGRGVRFLDVDTYVSSRLPAAERDSSHQHIREIFKAAVKSGELIDQVRSDYGWLHCM